MLFIIRDNVEEEIRSDNRELSHEANMILLVAFTEAITLKQKTRK